MSEKKKMNTYVKLGVILFSLTVVGMILGYSMIMLDVHLLLASFQGVILQFVKIISTYLLPELVVVLISEVVFGEIYLKKVKHLGKKLVVAEDEEGDRIDYEMEKVASIGTGILAVCISLAIVLIATACFIEQMESMTEIRELKMIRLALIVFLAVVVYNGFWSVRLVKIQQKADPTKQADPTSTKFTEQWVESCDEAEKELIYQSAYKTYLVLSKWIPILIVVAFLTHLIWNTGVAAMIYMEIVWMIFTISYLNSSVKKRRQKLNM